MPELPEVETIRLGLQKTIIGKRIEKFESLDSKVVQFASKDVEGYFISDIQRRAKILIFYLNSSRPASSNDKYSSNESEKLVLCHLKMTGQLIWEECGGESEYCLRKIKGPSTELRTTQRVAGGHPSPDWVAKLPTQHTRAIFNFDDGSKLFFNDLRRFGYMKLYDTKELSNIKELKNLGPEPLQFADAPSGQASADAFDVEYLMRKASKVPNRKIKQFITDQEIISGVGNIYVDEALFYAGISPLRPAKEIKLSEWTKIIESIKKALELGLKYGGSSEDTYIDAFGNQGTMGDHTKVYRKTGQPCPNSCGGTIKRITLGGRGTHYCPACQS